MYEGYFFDYPEEEQVEDVERRENDHPHDKDWLEDIAARKTRVFERMVLEKIVEKENKETAAIIEYTMRVSYGGGFWNDPKTSEIEWNEEGAEEIAKRTIIAFRETRMNEGDKQTILEKAGLLE